MAPASSLPFAEVLRPLAMLAHATAPPPPPESWGKIASMISSLEARLKDSLPEEAPGAPRSRLWKVSSAFRGLLDPEILMQSTDYGVA